MNEPRNNSIARARGVTNARSFARLTWSNSFAAFRENNFDRRNGCRKSAKVCKNPLAAVSEKRRELTADFHCSILLMKRTDFARVARVRNIGNAPAL